MNDEIDNLLRRQPCFHPEIRQGQIVAALALVFEVVALAKPGVPKAKVLRHPSVKKLLWHLRAEIDALPHESPGRGAF